MNTKGGKEKGQVRIRPGGGERFTTDRGRHGLPASPGGKTDRHPPDRTLQHRGPEKTCGAQQTNQHVDGGKRRALRSQGPQRGVLHRDRAALRPDRSRSHDRITAMARRILLQ